MYYWFNHFKILNNEFYNTFKTIKLSLDSMIYIISLINFAIHAFWPFKKKLSSSDYSSH